MGKSAITQAREKAGLSLEQAAKQAGVQPSYLQKIERHGTKSPYIAETFAHIFGGCDPFLFRPKYQQPSEKTQESTPRPPVAAGKRTT